ncbi:MAG: hypothetical protein ABJI96_02175 [Paracoccaceae bacterium]
MPLIRTRADIDDKLGGPLPAEVKLMAACEAGEPCVLGDGSLPVEGNATREVRADVLRYLIVGGCENFPVADWGVQVIGAYVSGNLDLSFAKANGVTTLFACRFQQDLGMFQASLENLNLSQSHLNGLNAQRAKITGDIFLRDIVATATIDFSGAEIGGQLDCTGAQFNATEGLALDAQGAKITDDIFLRDVVATATIDFSGAEIGGQLSCTSAQFNATEGVALNAQGAKITESVFLRDIVATATIHVSGAEIGGQLSCMGAQFNATEGFALDAQGAQISGGLIWRNVSFPSQPVLFAAAHTSALADDLDSWESGAIYDLDGFTYDRIYGSMNARERTKWLEKGSYSRGEFAPQPFTQLAKVLRESGHDGEARKVLFKREQLLRRNIRDQQRIAPNGDISVRLRSIWRFIKNGFRHAVDLLLRWVVGYGHHPFQSLWLLIALIVLAICPAHLAYEEGSFAPNSGPIQASAAWQDYANAPGNPAERWSAKWAPGQDWETFNRYAYAADLVIPIIDLGQTAAWAPSTTRGWWGKQLWWAQWFFIAMGWIVTALGAAAITGIIRRD